MAETLAQSGHFDTQGLARTVVLSALVPWHCVGGLAVRTPVTITKNRTPMTYLKTRSHVGPYQPFGGMLDQFFANIDQVHGRDELSRAFPRVNIVENNDAFKLELEAPGYTKDELKLNVENDVMTISAEQEQEDLKEDERFTRHEFSKRSFTRSFRLPELVQLDAITAEHLNGVLSVSIPKKAEVKPVVKEISIG
jgi:HSP20 family protein